MPDFADNSNEPLALNEGLTVCGRYLPNSTAWGLKTHRALTKRQSPIDFQVLTGTTNLHTSKNNKNSTQHKSREACKLDDTDMVGSIVQKSV